MSLCACVKDNQLQNGQPLWGHIPIESWFSIPNSHKLQLKPLLGHRLSKTLPILAGSILCTAFSHMHCRSCAKRHNPFTADIHDHWLLQLFQSLFLWWSLCLEEGVCLNCTIWSWGPTVCYVLCADQMLVSINHHLLKKKLLQWELRDVQIPEYKDKPWREDDYKVDLAESKSWILP